MEPKSIPTQFQSLKGLYPLKEKSICVNSLVYIFIPMCFLSLVSNLQPTQQRCFYKFKNTVPEG